MIDSLALPTIGILGGTGKEGKGLAYRWTKAGYPILIGSRSKEKANATASEIIAMLGSVAKVQGASNHDAARMANIIVITVPYSAHRETLLSVKSELQGKLLIDVTVPLNLSKITQVQMPPAGSAAQEAVEILGPGIDVATAFQNISYELLLQEKPIDCDILVTGTSKDARTKTLGLVTAAGMVGWDAGAIENSMVVEGLTSILIRINKKLGISHAGFRITGTSEKESSI
jgi:8-hydroxy-5-deazaflavin:NADPH oxidoreductase